VVTSLGLDSAATKAQFERFVEEMKGKGVEVALQFIE